MRKLDIENILLDYGNRLLDVANNKENPTLGELIEKPTEALTQLFKEEVEQIIGKNEPTRQLSSPEWNYVKGQNDLRAEARARLNKTIEEIK